MTRTQDFAWARRIAAILTSTCIATALTACSPTENKVDTADNAKPEPTQILDDRPEASQPHNIRLVYWERDPEDGYVSPKDRTYSPKIWRLNVPREHLYRRAKQVHPGKYIFPRGHPMSKPDYSIVTGRIDPDSLEVIPLERGPRRTSEGYVRVNLKPGRYRTSDWEKLCRPAYYKNKLRSPDYNFDHYCKTADHKISCTYSYEIDGWPLRMSVPRTLPKPPEAYCDIITDWLDTMTVSREPLSTEGRKSYADRFQPTEQ